MEDCVMKIFTLQNKEVLCKIITQLGYEEQHIFVKKGLEFFPEDCECNKLTINYKDINWGVPIADFVDTETPLELEKHLFTFVTEDTDGNISFIFFTDFDKNISHIYTAYVKGHCYKNLSLYFVEDTTEEDISIIPVSFFALIENVSVENFGEIKEGQVVDRAVLIWNEEDINDDVPTVANDSVLSEQGLTPSSYMEEHGLNNILELALYTDNIDITVSHPAYRYFTTIEELNKAAVIVAEETGKNVAVIICNSIRKGTVNIENHTVTWEDDIEEMFEHSKTYWQSVYEEE